MKNWNSSRKNVVVSIVCSTYNHEMYISKCLDGFLLQKTKFPFEIIVHDDASTDHTAEIIRSYELKFPHIIKPIYEVENQYSKHDGSIWKKFESRLNGEYIAICEGDDYWTNSHKLQKQYECLCRHPECVIAFNRVEFVDAEGNSVNYYAPHINKRFNEIVTLDDFCKEEFLNGRWTFHTSSIFEKIDTYKKFIVYKKNEFASFPYADLPHILYALMNGNGIFIDEVCGCYRTFSGGFNSSLEKNPQKGVSTEEALIMALNDFDRITKGKYHKYVQCRIKRSIFYSNYYKGKYISLLSWKYFGVIKMKERLSTILKGMSPKFYKKLRRWYRNI